MTNGTSFARVNPGSLLVIGWLTQEGATDALQSVGNPIKTLLAADTRAQTLSYSRKFGSR